MADQGVVRSDSDSYGSRRDLVRRRRNGGAGGSQEGTEGKQMYQPGTPIGYFAARGTPYERKYFTRKLGFCCLFLAPPIIVVTLVIALVPVLWAIARHALHTSQLHIYESNITAIQNTTFAITIEGQAKKTGIFPAKLYFRKPIDVYWNTPPPNMQELHLGYFSLAPLGAAAGHAKVKQLTQFYITDEEGFGTFSEFLVTQPQFTWKTVCPEVHAEGFAFFPTFKSLTFTKHVIFNGIDNFHDIKILDLQLPGDDPAGGIQAIAVSSLINPSPFGVQVGTLNLGLYYKDLYIGPVTVNNLNLTTGLNVVTLAGRVLPYADNQTALEILGELFTNYINSYPSIVEGRGLSTMLANGQTISWLTKGLQQLRAQIPFVPPEPIDPIKGITIDYISLVYKLALPYNPDLFSNDLRGKLVLPFGFSLAVLDLSTVITIEFMGAAVGTVFSPYGNSTTNVYLQTQRQTAADITIALPPSQLSLPNSTDAAKRQLIEFQNAFLYSSSASFTAKGSAKAITDTPIGRILLNGITFEVGTGLRGLSGLSLYPTIINSVDVVGGTSEDIDLVVGTTVVNPSNLNLSTGDVTFNLLNQVPVGTVTLPGLNLKIGRNDINATSKFDPNRAPQGIEALNRFVSGLDTNLNITGISQAPFSSEIASLAPSLEGIRLNATLPGLQQLIVQSANLTVLDTTGITDDIADSHVEAFNPFTAALTITRINANASSHGIYIATIDTALNFPAAGKAVTTSPVVPLALNLYPPDLFALVRALAVQSGQNPAYIDGLVQLGGFTLTPTTAANGGTPTKRSLPEEEVQAESEAQSYDLEEDNEMAQMLMGIGSNPGVYVGEAVEDEDGLEVQSDGISKRAHSLVYDPSLVKRANLYTGFDITTYVGRAFSVATADLVIIADTTIGDYGTTLTFSQNNVPLGTDVTLFKLLPVLALPIVQRIVDGSVLNIDRVTITEARPTSFTAALQGALTNAGPFDAVVTFPQGLTIYWEGQALTQTAFPNITLVGDLGAAINVQVEGQIPDVGYFTSFLEYAILNPSFLWNIRGSGITVAALGIVVPNITINKDVQLTGLNGLQGQVIINSFDVPYNDPAGGLHLTAISTINNPAQVGVALTAFGTNIMMGNTMVGPAAAADAFTLQALAVTQVPLAGRIQRQDSQQGLADLSEIFTRFVHNQNTNLLVMGEYAGPSDVEWLNNGIKALKVTVALPAQDFQVIRLVSINQLSLFFTVPTAYAPMSDTTNTSANFFLPFAFPVDITTVAGPFIANYQNTDMAVLNIPTSPTTTNVESRILYVTFQNVPFAVYDPAHQVFSQFVTDVTKSEQVTFNLHGSATGLTQTAAGALNIQDIPFDLNTNILGLQNLNARPAQVSDLDVLHGYPTYLDIRVNTALYNPSDITIGAQDVSFAALFQANVIGDALINNILLVPGNNLVPTQINYMPIGATNVRSGQTLLENYVQNVTSDATVAGTSQTTPIDSLKQALGQITLTAAIPPLEKLIVVQAELQVPKNIAQTGVAAASVMIANPFTASINIINLIAQANFEGITIGRINDNLESNPVHAGGKTTTLTRQIPINIDINPKTLIRFILAAAATYNVDLGPNPPFFQEVLDLSDTTTTISPYPDDQAPPCKTPGAFDTLGAILRLLAPLQTSIPIQSVLKLDDYQTNLNFIQQPVPTKTDNTALYLVGPAGAPLIQLVVNQSTLIANRANATSLTSEGFTATILGALKAVAPADAYIEFPEPVQIIWQGQHIADIALPGLCNAYLVGIPDLLTTGQLTINPDNYGGFEDFTYFLLTQPSFQWTLRSPTVSVRALGIKFSNVYLEKTISLDAFNGLPGIRITRFSAPSDTLDPAPRINIDTDAAIPSPASLGVELGTATFDLRFNNVYIGQASSQNLFLAYKTTTTARLLGFLSDQTGNQDGLNALGILFSQFLAGNDSTLEAYGNNVVGPVSNGQIRWLTAAFKRFHTPVILPGHVYKIILSIKLSDLTATVPFPGQSDSYKIQASNNETVAFFQNPFGFGLSVIEAGPQITITYDNTPAAGLSLPLAKVVSSGTSHGEPAELVINFKNQLLYSLNNGAFSAFLAQIADTPEAAFGLSGNTSVVAGLVIGDPTITGIPFDVQTTFPGINSFNHKATVMDVVVDDPTNEFIGIHLNAGLTNPAPLNLFTQDISLPTRYINGGSNPYIGRAALINPNNIYRGDIVLATLFEFIIPSGGDQAAVENVLTLYLQPTDFMSDNKPNIIPLRIDGSADGDATDLGPESLLPALRGITADTTLTGISTAIAQSTKIYVPPSALTQQLASILGSLPGIGDALKGILGNLPIPGNTGNDTSGDVYVYAFLYATNDIPSELVINSLTGPVFDTTDKTQIAFIQPPTNFGYELDAAYGTKRPSPGGTNKPSPQLNNIRLTLPQPVLLNALKHLHNLDVQLTINANIINPNTRQSYNIPSLKYEQHNINTSYFISLTGSGMDGIPLAGLGNLIPASGLPNLQDIFNFLKNNGLTNVLTPILDAIEAASPGGILNIGALSGLASAAQTQLCSLVGILGVKCPAATATSTANSTNPVAGVVAKLTAGASSAESVATSVVSSVVSDVTGGVQGAVSNLVSNLGGKRGLSEPEPTQIPRRSSFNQANLQERDPFRTPDPRAVDALEQFFVLAQKEHERNKRGAAMFNGPDEGVWVK